jgi:hypothetical protein
MPATPEDFAQLLFETKCTEALLNRERDPWGASALAFDARFEATAKDFPLIRRLRDSEADPIFRSAGAPEGTNTMNGMTNGQYGNNYGPPDLDPRGRDQTAGPEPTTMTPQMLIQLVELCLRGLDDPSERSEFLSELANLLSGSENEMMDGGDQYSTTPSSAPPPSYNAAPYARLRSSTTGDRRRGRNGRASDRNIAMDSTVRSLNQASFYRRWGPQVGKISLSGNGRPYSRE